MTNSSLAGNQAAIIERDGNQFNPLSLSGQVRKKVGETKVERKWMEYFSDWFVFHCILFMLSERVRDWLAIHVDESICMSTRNACQSNCLSASQVRPRSQPLTAEPLCSTILFYPSTISKRPLYVVTLHESSTHKRDSFLSSTRRKER